MTFLAIPTCFNFLAVSFKVAPDPTTLVARLRTTKKPTLFPKLLMLELLSRHLYAWIFDDD